MSSIKESIIMYTKSWNKICGEFNIECSHIDGCVEDCNGKVLPIKLNDDINEDIPINLTIEWHSSGSFRSATYLDPPEYNDERECTKAYLTIYTDYHWSNSPAPVKIVLDENTTEKLFTIYEGEIYQQQLPEYD